MINKLMFKYCAFDNNKIGNRHLLIWEVIK